MKLKDIFESIIKEFGEEQPEEIGTNDDQMQNIALDDDDVLEFPNQHFSISIFRDEKKLLFTPQQHQSIPNKIRTFVNDLKQNFRIQSVSQKDLGAFEVQLDQREDLDSVVDFIKQEIENQ